MEKIVKFLEARAIEDDDVVESDEMQDIPWGVGSIVDNYNHREVLTTIKEKQGWAGSHEEGVISLSTKGPAHARILALNEYTGGEDDGEEDWH